MEVLSIGKVRILSFLIMSTIFCGYSYGQLGSYVTSNEYPGGIIKRGPGLSSDVKIPTNDWCTSLLWRRASYAQFSGELYAHPLSFRANANGMGVRHHTNPTILPNQPPWEPPYYAFDRNNGIDLDFTVGVSSLSTTITTADDFSDWTITADWTDETNNRNLKATIGHGLPYAYFKKSAGGEAVINFDHHITSMWGSGNVRGVTVNGSHYGIFAPTGADWTISGTGNTNWSSTLDNKLYWSVCALPDNSVETLEFYANHAFAFVTDTRVEWSYNENTSEVLTEYTATIEAQELGHNTALLALYRHQWKNSNDINTSYKYSKTPRGEMKVMQGNTFSTTMKYHGIMPVIPRSVNNASYNSTIFSLFGANGTHSNPDAAVGAPYSADTYWSGKWLGRLAQLALIANQHGFTSQRNSYINAIKGELEEWFTEGGNKEFRYNNDMGVLIGFPADFGSHTHLNDHHFHYGYFIWAAAAVASFDQNWASRSTGYGEMVDLLIKNCANWDTTADNRFPRLRNFDPYAGHSWANGAGAGRGGNDQESSSEAMNFASGLIFWGSVTCNETIRDLGIYLYTTEAEAIEQYWFDVDEEVHPAEYNVKHVSILYGNGGNFRLHWSPPGNGVNERHGINLLPITGASIYLGKHPGYISGYLSQMMLMDGNINDVWRDIFWSYESLSQRSFYNASTAIARFNSTSAWAPENGTSRAATYHFINNINELGELHPQVTGNIPTSAVFSKNGTLTYVAYNPVCGETRDIIFSDGHVISNVGANHYVVSKGAVNSLENFEKDAAKRLKSFPNPFQGSTTFVYEIKDAGMARAKITLTDALGKEYAVANELKAQGVHKVVFHAEGLSSGMYIAKLYLNENFVESIKIVIQ